MSDIAVTATGMTVVGNASSSFLCRCGRVSACGAQKQSPLGMLQNRYTTYPAVIIKIRTIYLVGRHLPVLGCTDDTMEQRSRSGHWLSSTFSRRHILLVDILYRCCTGIR
ncbi:unnamed protein product [Sphacelaria rigidula]